MTNSQARLSNRSFLLKDDNLPTDVRRLGEVISDLVGISVAAQKHESPTYNSVVEKMFKEETALDGYGILAITGPRGSGKTTLLFATCLNLLRRGQCIVLPIARPETLKTTMSLPLLVVTQLADLLATATDDANTAETPDVTVIHQRAARLAALAAPSAARLVQEKNESLSQFALDATGLAASGDHLIPAIAGLANATRARLKLKPTAPIVVPVDDIDLVPRRTTEFLSDLRTLSCVPGLVPIVCANGADLQNHIEADLQREFGAQPASSGLYATLARQQIAKTLRPDFTIPTPAISPALRREFTPFGQTDTLIDAISKAIAPLFRDGENPRWKRWLNGTDASVWTTDPLSWLPSTPRALEGLWSVALNLSQALADGDPHGTATWLSKLLSMVADEASYSFTIYVDSVKFDGDRPQIAATALWAPLDINPRGFGNWRILMQSDTARIQWRLFATVDGMLLGSDGKSRTEMTRASVSSLIFIEELFQASAFDGARPLSPSYIGGGEYSSLQRVQMFGQGTDDSFFELPAAKGGSAVRDAQNVWNELIERQSTWSHSQRLGDADPHITEYVHLIIDKFMPSAPTRNAEDRDFEGVMSRAVAAYATALVSYRGAVFSEYSRDKAYAQWFEAGLPRLFHDQLLSGPVLTAAISSWSAALAGVSGRDAMEDLRRDMTERVSRSVSSRTKAVPEGVWFFGYSDLLSYFDTHLWSQVEHHGEEYSRLRSRSKLGRVVAGSSLDVGAVGSFSGNLPSEAGDVEASLIHAVLEQLRS